jgi:hypothetical protein
MARDDDDDDDRPRKKKSRPSADTDDDDRPRKKRPSRDDDDDDDDRPRKRRRRDEDEQEDDDDLGNSPLGAVVPLGTSIWALASFYLALVSCVVPLPLLGLIAVVLGAVSFFRQNHKASYGSITGNIRAVLGIVIGLFTMVGSTVFLIMLMSGKLR